MTFASMIKASKKVNSEALKDYEFQQIPCIYYPTRFDEFPIEALIDSKSIQYSQVSYRN